MRPANRSARRGRDASIAAVVAVVVVTSSVTLATVSASAASEPLPVQDLPSEPTWSADVPDGSGNWGPAFANGLIFAPTTRGVATYARSCEDPCEPLWRSDLPREWIGYAVDAGSGHVVVNGPGDGVHVFAADCADRGRVCSPAWSKAGRVTGANVVGSSVVATISKREGTRVAVYPLACSDPCAPVWSRLLRADYPSYGPSVLAHGAIYVRRGSVLWGVSLGCATGTGRCSVVFRVGHVPDATFPAVTPDQVIFGSGHGAESSEVVAYPTGCGHDCVPLWTGDAGGYVGDAPTVAGDVVVTASIGRLVAFPIACAADCAPAWVAEIPGYPVPSESTDSVVIVLSHRRPRAMYAFPTDCAAICTPMWSRSYTDATGDPKGTVSDGRRVFVAFPGRVVAHTLAAGRRVWRGALDPGEAWWLDARGRSLVAAPSGALNVFIASS